MLLTGKGGRKDFKRAFALAQQGADKGDKLSLSNLGFCYERGLGVRKDPAVALGFYKQAVAMGEASAMNRLGNLLYYDVVLSICCL